MKREKPLIIAIVPVIIIILAILNLLSIFIILKYRIPVMSFQLLGNIAKAYSIINIPIGLMYIVLAIGTYKLNNKSRLFIIYLCYIDLCKLSIYIIHLIIKSIITYEIIAYIIFDLFPIVIIILFYSSINVKNIYCNEHNEN